MGALLACGVYSTSSLRSLQSRLHFVVRPPFLVSVCPSPALAGGGGGGGCLITVLWPLLLLLCVGLLWGLCCAVLLPWPIVALSPSVFSRLGFFLWRLFGLRLVSCGPAWVPAFFWENSPSLVLVVFPWRFLLLGCSGSWSFLDSLLGFFPLASSVC